MCAVTPPALLGLRTGEWQLWPGFCSYAPPMCHGCSWERDKTHLRAHRGRQEPEKDEAPTDGDESMEPHEVALAREEVNLLLAEQRKTAALKVVTAGGPGATSWLATAWAFGSVSPSWGVR